jgi:hypothetical protein
MGDACFFNEFDRDTLMQADLLLFAATWYIDAADHPLQ